MLSTVYPEHNWLPWKFERANVGLWNDVKNQRKFLDWVSPQLNVKDLGDWYKVGEKVCFKRNFVEISGNSSSRWTRCIRTIQVIII